MRIFHISDLHIGKQLHLYNLRESQRYALAQIVQRVEEYRPDVLLIAGDIYDRSVPSGEAYEMLDDFLNDLAEITPSIPVLIIAGNHDNAARLKFASSFFRKHNIHIAVMPPQTEEEHLEKITLQDEYGEVDFYLLPFTKPAYVRGLFEEGKITDYHSAVAELLRREEIDVSRRNVLVAHQFFVSQGTAPQTSDSEITYISVGGLDSVDVSCVMDFDYVALGHIHGAQRIGADHIRYSGTPLKYSVSEEHHRKGILMVTMGEKGTENLYERIPIEGKPDVRSIRGTLQEVIALANDEKRDDYVSIVLTDEELYRPKDQLDEHYSHILEVRVDNKRTQSRLENADAAVRVMDPLSAFREFYQEMNGQPLSEKEENVFLEILEQAKNDAEQESVI